MEKLQQLRRNLLERSTNIVEEGDRSDYFEFFDIKDTYGIGSHVFKIRPKRGVLKHGTIIEMELMDEGGLPIPISVASDSSTFEERFLPSHRLSFTINSNTVSGVGIFVACGTTVDGKSVKYIRRFLIDKGISVKPVIDRGV